MSYLVIFGILACLALFAVFYIWKNYQSIVEEKNAVPLSQLAEIDSANNQPSLSLKTDSLSSSRSSSKDSVSLTDHLMKENLKSSVPKPILKKDEPPVNLKELSEENQSIKDRLAELQDENRQLKSNVEELNSQIKALNDSTLSNQEIERLKNECSQWKENVDEQKEKIKVLEANLLNAEKDKSELAEDSSAIDTLKFEKAALEQSQTEMEEKMKRVDDELANLRENHQQFLNKSQTTIVDLNKKNQEIYTQWKADQKRVSELEDQLKHLTQQKEDELLKLQEKYQSAADSAHKIESMQKEYSEMLTLTAELKVNYQKLKEFNAHLLEKEKLLQYELTKSRAQTLGLERICEDFKVLIEEKNRVAKHISSPSS